MRIRTWVLLLTLTGLIKLALLGWLGLRWTPKPYPPFAPRPTEPPSPAPWPESLPATVRRAFGAVLPDGPRSVSTAVISGRASLNVNGMPFKARFRFIHEAGRNYRHAFEVTWFNLPIIRASESFLDGYCKLNLGPIGKAEGTPALFQAATLALWSESIWLPSILVTDPRLRWEAIDDAHARVFVPLGEREDTLLVTFDSVTGRIAAIDGLRYRDSGPTAQKLGWHCVIREYGTVGGAIVPTVSSIQWSDMDAPWAVWTVEDIVYNADVSAAMREPTANGKQA